MTGHPSEPIRWENLSAVLIECLPELKDEYEQELRDWMPDSPGAHVVYGDLLNPYLDHLLALGDDVSLERVFVFLGLTSESLHD